MTGHEHSAPRSWRGTISLERLGNVQVHPMVDAGLVRVHSTQASEKLAQAAEVMSEHPAALQLRLLQTVVEVAAETNSTLVLPFPVELLRFLEKVTPSEPTQAETRRSIDPPTDLVPDRIVVPKPMMSAVRLPEQTQPR